MHGRLGTIELYRIENKNSAGNSVLNNIRCEMYWALSIRHIQTNRVSFTILCVESCTGGRRASCLIHPKKLGSRTNMMEFLQPPPPSQMNFNVPPPQMQQSQQVKVEQQRFPIHDSHLRLYFYSLAEGGTIDVRQCTTSSTLPASRATLSRWIR